MSKRRIVGYRATTIISSSCGLDYDYIDSLIEAGYRPYGRPVTSNGVMFQPWVLYEEEEVGSSDNQDRCEECESFSDNDGWCNHYECCVRPMGSTCSHHSVR
jgi:hypothetical protein